MCCRQGYYDTMDAGILTEDGNIAVMARSDDVINVAGHRLSTGALEEVVDCHSHHSDDRIVITSELQVSIILVTDSNRR